MNADLHHFDEEQDPDPYQNEKWDPGSHHGNVDPQHLFLLRIRILGSVSRIRVLSLSGIEENQRDHTGAKTKINH